MSLLGSRREAVGDLFKRFDVKGDGQISKEELREVLQNLDAGLWTDERIETLFAQVDSNGNGVIDMDEFVSWVFDDGSDIQEDVFGAVGFARGAAIDTDTSASLGVPEGMHSETLRISEDRTTLESVERKYQGAFLSSVLPQTGTHALRVSIIGDQHDELYIGLCRSTMTEFHFLRLLAFCPCCSWDNCDNLPAEKHYEGHDVTRVYREGGATMLVDMDACRLALLDRFGLEVGYWTVEGLNTMDVVFAASVDSAVTLKLEVPGFLVTLDPVVAANGRGVELLCTSMAGAELATVDIPDAGATTWNDARILIQKSMPAHLNGFSLAFMLADGTLLTNAHNTQSVADTLPAASSNLS